MQYLNRYVVAIGVNCPINLAKRTHSNFFVKRVAK